MNDSSDPYPPPRTTGGGWRWEPPSPAELQRLLPQFEVECLIGRGGMGAVYRGIQSSLERPVAIKLLPPAIEQQDSAFAERFKNEAKLMGRMNHPAIVSVYDFGHTSDGQLYFVMEFVDGTDVQRMIAREGRLPAEHALAVTAHLCDALAYAHKNGIVHRDIKPSNVLIDLEGRVKAADFGLAKLTTNSANSGLTQTGMAMGTPDYLAPETLTLGSDVDGRADLYAVGVMLYQMLTGDIPRGMFRMPSQKFRNIDPRFDAIVRRALEHDREERYQTSIEIRRDLDVILTTPYAEPGRESSAAVPKQAPQAQGRTVVPSTRNPASASNRHARRFEPTPAPKPAPSATSSSLAYVIAALVFLGVGAWFVIPKHNTDPANSLPSTTDTPAEVNPFEPSTADPFPPAATTATPQPPTQPTKSSPSAQPATSTPTVTTKTPASGPSTPTQFGTSMIPPPKTVPPVNLPPLPPPSTIGPIYDHLSTLESQFQNAFERDVNAAYAEQITTLGAGYVTALERAGSEATRAGKLDEAIALRDEKTRFTTHKFMPSIDPPGLHRSVVQLRNTYRATEKTYSQQKDASSLPLYDRYIEVLDSLEKQLKAQGRVGDADRVRIKRNDVVARRKQRAAKVPAGVQVLPQTKPAVAKLNLFDGQSLNGWRILGDPQAFVVRNGEIRTNDKPGGLGLLVYVGSGGTAPVWRDFSIEFRFKCEQRTNSGIFLHVPDPGILTSRKVTAFEVNIDESSKATGSIMGAVNLETGLPLNHQLVRVGGGGGFGAGARLLAGRPKFAEWQQMRIVARSGVFTVWIDAEPVSSWAFPSGWTPPADKGVLQTFEGTVALQCGFGSTAFKDIVVEVL